MKVLLLNGSPREAGCTYTALCEVAGALEKNGIETEIFQVGKKPISGCVDCEYTDDGVAEFIEKAEQADGFIFGSPVYYASITGQVSSFLDRAFSMKGKAPFEGKPAAGIVSCRRAGSTASLDQFNKYFTISGMPVVSSCYWNMVHGNTPDEVRQDKEGLQIMRTLGNNMAWLLRCIELGKKEGIAYPEKEPKIKTNFIR